MVSGILHGTYTANAKLVSVAKIKTGNGTLKQTSSKTQDAANQYKLTSIQKLRKMILQKRADSIAPAALSTSKL